MGVGSLQREEVPAGGRRVRWTEWPQGRVAISVRFQLGRGAAQKGAGLRVVSPGVWRCGNPTLGTQS